MLIAKDMAQCRQSQKNTTSALEEILKPDSAIESLIKKVCKNGRVSIRVVHQETDENRYWYALRATYGRELQACQSIIKDKGIAFCPTITEYKLIKGKRKAVEVSRFPNILFAYGTEKEIQDFVYDNVHYDYLRFYYRHRHDGHKIIKEPLIVPTEQIESLKIICASEASDVVIVPQDAIIKFRQGECVRITEGAFAGVEGHVARFYGQQRVAVIIDDLVSVATAYVPSAFLEKKGTTTLNSK